MLETLRQFGAELLDEAGELDDVRGRHLGWCLSSAAALHAGNVVAAGTELDALADELRAALTWAAGRAERREEAYRLADVLAALCHRNGHSEEAQRRYEQAAAFAGPGLVATVALHRAAGVAGARLAGDDALRLHRAAAAAALDAGEPARAAAELAQAAELTNRCQGMIADLPARGMAGALLADARALAGDEPRALARIAIAEAWNLADDDPGVTERAGHALDLARASRAPLAESAALDRITSIHLSNGRVRAAEASARRRTELLAPLPADAETSFELADALEMAADTAIAAGELRQARRAAEGIRDLPMHGEIGHVAAARLVLVSALAGDLAEAVQHAATFREGWERAGRPRIGTLRRSAWAAGAVHGLRGDIRAREEWLAVADALAPPGRARVGLRCAEFFDALLLLHLGRPADALGVLAVPVDRPEHFDWLDGLWRPWYAALWAEAAVLGEASDAADRLAAAHPLVAENPVATAVLVRAAALLGRNRAGVLEAATAVDAAGCRYQWARSLVLAGGPERKLGLEAMAAMGAARPASVAGRGPDP
jgi:hypothetical protein